MFTADESRLKELTRNVRFNENKVKYIIEVRKKFPEIKERINTMPANQLREWLASKNGVKGFGPKESAHFLRNIGFKGYAILDKHILNSLIEFGVVDEIKMPLNRDRYLGIEGKMKVFSNEIGIPMDELDLLFWSIETGKVFK